MCTLNFCQSILAYEEMNPFVCMCIVMSVVAMYSVSQSITEHVHISYMQLTVIILQLH